MKQFFQPLKAKELQEHMISTYFCLRIGLALIAIALPLGLLLSARWIGLLNSMSAYYHSPMRNFFVGALVAIGCGLYVYKGFTNFENIALNFAGLFVVLVAMLPTSAPPDVVAFTAPRLHAVFAIAFFLSVAAVCLTASRRANRCGMTDCRNRFRGQYATIGIAMVLLPATAAGLAFTLRPLTVVFWIEFAAIAVFAWYWILQTIEYWDVDVAVISGTGPSDNV